MWFPALKSESSGRICFLSLSLIGCSALLSVGPVEAQDPLLSPVIFFQCNASGVNLNEDDNIRQSWVDWGSVISYLEGAQRDMAQDGSSGGPFEHYGVMIVKEQSKSSPAYMDALHKDTNLDGCTVHFLYSTPSGSEAIFYTVELNNPRVAQITIQGSGEKILEEITFRAASTTRTHVPSGSSSTQSLGVPP